MEIAKKICNVALTVITWLIVLFTVTVTVFTVTALGRGEQSLFGYRFFIVRSDSMKLSENNADLDVHFKAGDIVISKNLTDEEKKSLQPGQIISFISTNKENYGENVTHMIRRAETDMDGNVTGYVTYGTSTGDNDEKSVQPSYILGVFVKSVPNLGNFFAFLKSTKGYIFCILIPCLLLCLYHGIRIFVLSGKYRKEQTDAIEAEKAELDAQRKQNEELFRELQALKAELLKQTVGESGEEKPAAEGTEAAENTEAAESTEATESTEAAENTEATEGTEEAESTEEAETTEVTETVETVEGVENDAKSNN